MQADLGEGVLVVLQLDDLAAGGGAEAVAVGDHQCAAALDELGQAGIVDLGADDGHSCAEGALLVGLAGLQLGQRLSQVGQDQGLGAAVGDQVQHMELIAGDHRVVGLAHLADLGDDAADLVVLLHSLADGGVRSVNTEHLGHSVQHAQAHLPDVGVQRVVRDLVGHVRVGHKEVGLVVDMQDLEVLHGAVHHGAGVNADQRIQELVAALDRPLQQCPGKLAGVVGHVVGGDVDGPGVGCAQPY